MVFAVAVTCVWPEAFVTAGADSAAEAPAPGGVNVTVAPGTALLNASLTTTTSGLANAPFTARD